MSLNSAHSAIIQLSNGDTINADVIKRTDTIIKISHPVLGIIDLPTRNITAIDGQVFAAKVVKVTEDEQVAKSGADQKSSKTVAVDDSQIKEIKKIDEDSGLFDIHLRPLKNWEHKLGGGFNGKQGNTNTTTAHIDYRGNFEDKGKRWAIRSIYDFNEGDENDSLNEFYAEATRDWLRLGHPRFYFATGKYEWDEFRSWDYRILGTLGTGYEYIKRRDLLVLGRIGIAGQKTVGGSDPGLVPEFMFGGDIDKTFSEIHSVTLKTAFFQDFTNSESWRNTSNLDWDIVISRLWGLGLTLGLQNEYESIPDVGDVNNDFKYKLSFVWGWGGSDDL